MSINKETHANASRHTDSERIPYHVKVSKQVKSQRTKLNRNTSVQPEIVSSLLRVFLVKSSFTIARMIKDVLGEFGHALEQGEKGDSAVTAAEQGRCDLIVLDQGVSSDVHLYEKLIKRIRQTAQARGDELPIYVIVSDITMENIQVLKQAGASEVIVRFTDKELREKLRNLISLCTAKNKARSESSKPNSQRNENVATLSKQGLDSQKSNTTSNVSSPTRSGDKAKKVIDVEMSSSSQSAQAPVFAEANSQHVIQRQPNIFNRYGKMFLFGFVTLVSVAVTLFVYEHYTHVLTVEVITVQKSNDTSSDDYSGRVISRKQINLTTSVPGQIKHVYVQENDRVRKGMRLAALNDQEAQLNLDLAEANLANKQLELDQLRASYQRLKKGVEQGKKTKQELDELGNKFALVRTKEKVAINELEIAKFELDRLVVVAPFDGVLMLSYAVEGLWSEPPGVLFKIVDRAEREIVFETDNKTAKLLEQQSVVNLSADAFPDFNWQSTVVHIKPSSNEPSQLETADGDMFVYIDIGDNAPPLRYGQEVKIHTISQHTKGAIMLPVDAVRTQEGRKVVAVVDGDTIKFLLIESERHSETEIAVLSGLEPGQQVIISKQPLKEKQHIHPVNVTL